MFWPIGSTVEWLPALFKLTFPRRGCLPHHGYLTPMPPPLPPLLLLLHLFQSPSMVNDLTRLFHRDEAVSHSWSVVIRIFSRPTPHPAAAAMEAAPPSGSNSDEATCAFNVDRKFCFRFRVLSEIQRTSGFNTNSRLSDREKSGEGLNEKRKKFILP